MQRSAGPALDAAHGRVAGGGPRGGRRERGRRQERGAQHPIPPSAVRGTSFLLDCCMSTFQMRKTRSACVNCIAAYQLVRVGCMGASGPSPSHLHGAGQSKGVAKGCHSAGDAGLLRRRSGSSTAIGPAPRSSSATPTACTSPRSWRTTACRSVFRLATQRGNYRRQWSYPAPACPVRQTVPALQLWQRMMLDMPRLSQWQIFCGDRTSKSQPRITSQRRNASPR